MDAEGRIYRYLHAETGHVSFAFDYWNWEIAIKEHRKSNNLPPIDMAVAEDQLCGSIPPDRCLYEVGDKPPVFVRLGLGQVRAWVIAIFNRWKDDLPLVDKAEAERRAAICVRCPYNVMVEGGCGGGCQRLTELFTPGMRGRETKEDSRLKSCAICSCYNRVQVHFPVEVLEEGATAEQRDAYPSAFCWKSPHSPNYIST